MKQLNMCQTIVVTIDDEPITLPTRFEVGHEPDRDMNCTKMMAHVPTLPTIPARVREATQWKNSSVLGPATHQALPVLEDMIRKGYVRPAEDGKLVMTEKGALSFFRFCARSSKQLVARATNKAA